MREHDSGHSAFEGLRAGRAGARSIAALVAAALLLAACQGGPASESVELAHIHGLGVNPADGRLYAASHRGVFLVDGRSDPQQIAGRTQDFMGFTVLGPDHFLGSGHPGADDTAQPPLLGLIESTDAAQTWTPLSLSGQADFHAMEAEHGMVYGYDSQSGQIMVSSDKKTWDRRGRLPLADFAVSPDDPALILATTQVGLARSSDGGRAFSAVPTAPALALVDWPAPALLVGVAPWERRGAVPGAPQAIAAVGESEVYIATEDAIHRSTDGGRTFTVFEQL
jgi:hypothetical protein